jgi:serine/threonine-protein kinase HipA
MLPVYLYDQRIGIIEQRGAGLRFTYADAAVDDDACPALSVSLPKRREPYTDREAGPFFRNLLPEQAYRGLVAAAAGTVPGDSVALLGAIGAECPGAVSIWPQGHGPPTIHEYEPLSEEAMRTLFSEAGRPRLGSAVARGRLSLPGVQEKIALLRRADGGWHMPLHGAVTSHILKRPTLDFEELLENEVFCMVLAEKVGLRVPAVGIPAAGVRVYCAERFDRTVEASSDAVPRRRVHQEDFCQLLRVPPERKYQRHGGPSLARCARVIREFSALPAEDLPALLRWVGFNCLIGNEDAHAKNLAFLYSAGGLRLTPHYDLVSTAVYPHLQREAAMKVGGAWDLRDVQKSDWRRLAARVDLPWDRVRVLLLELSALAATLRSEVRELCASRFGQATMYARIAEIVARQAARMDRELSSP